jgi:hypothetical protein
LCLRFSDDNLDRFDFCNVRSDRFRRLRCDLRLGLFRASHWRSRVNPCLTLRQGATTTQTVKDDAYQERQESAKRDERQGHDARQEG